MSEDSRQLQVGCSGKLRNWVVMFFFQHSDAARRYLPAFFPPLNFHYLVQVILSQNAVPRHRA